MGELHSYINADKLNKKPTKLTIQRILNDFKKYNIQGSNGSLNWALAEQLIEDYRQRETSYLAYIEENMDVNMLIQLRMSALLRIETTHISSTERDFYNAHKMFNEPEEVHDFRTFYIRQYQPSYTGEV